MKVTSYHVEHKGKRERGNRSLLLVQVIPEFASRNGPGDSFVLVALQSLLLLQAITILKEYNSESNILSCRAQGQERER